MWGDQNTRWKLFITRFFNCEVCYGKMDLGGLAKCHQSFREHFEFASCRAHRCAAVFVWAATLAVAISCYHGRLSHGSQDTSAAVLAAVQGECTVRELLALAVHEPSVRRPMTANALVCRSGWRQRWTRRGSTACRCSI